jgi:alanine racemase
MRRGPLVEIDLDSISHNLRLVRNASPGRKVIGVVKADAYGHGMVEVSKVLIRGGVDSLAVAYLDEGVLLREAGIKDIPVIVLFDNEPSGDFFRFRLTPVVHNLSFLREISSLASKEEGSIGIHINIDTGMGRLGFPWYESDSMLDQVLAMEDLRVEGLMSHFSEAEISDEEFTCLQMNRFENALSLFRKRGLNPLVHFANSAAVFRLPQAHYDAVRPGLALYGSAPYSPDAGLRAAMSVKTVLIDVRRLREGEPVSYGRTFVTARESLIGVVPMGYADGLHRAGSNNLDVLVRGKRAPVVGRICMDLTMVDLTEVESPEVGDEVVIIGRQGGEEIRVEEVAERTGTIPYEMMTSLGSVNRRVFKCEDNYGE